MSITAPAVFAGDAQQQEPEKRRQILDGAACVFLASGYEGASMSVIAHEAGVSKGTLYVYFTNKEALFSAVVHEYCQRHAEHVFDALDSTSPVEAALLECGRRYASVLTDPAAQAIYRLVIAESAKFPVLGRMFFETGPQRSINRVVDFVRARAAAGELLVEDCELAAMEFIGLCRSDIFIRTLLKAADGPGAAEVERIARSAVRVFMSAYRAPR